MIVPRKEGFVALLSDTGELEIPSNKPLKVNVVQQIQLPILFQIYIGGLSAIVLFMLYKLVFPKNYL